MTLRRWIETRLHAMTARIAAGPCETAAGFVRGADQLLGRVLGHFVRRERYTASARFAGCLPRRRPVQGNAFVADGAGMLWPPAPPERC